MIELQLERLERARAAGARGGGRRGRRVLRGRRGGGAGGRGRRGRRRAGRAGLRRAGPPAPVPRTARRSPSGPTARPPRTTASPTSCTTTSCTSASPPPGGRACTARSGLRMEAAWGARAAEEAATLPMHFEAGRDWCRAVRYLRQAAGAASRQYAHREAVRYLRRALELLDRLLAGGPRGARAAAADVARREPPGDRRLRRAGVQAALRPRPGAVRARDAAASVHDTFPVLWGIWMFHKVRSDLREADADRPPTARAGGDGRRPRAARAGAPGDVRDAPVPRQLRRGTVDHMERVLRDLRPGAARRQHRGVRPGPRRRDAGVRVGRAVADGPGGREPGDASPRGRARDPAPPAEHAGAGDVLLRDAAPAPRRRRRHPQSRREDDRAGRRGRVHVLARGRDDPARLGRWRRAARRRRGIAEIRRGLEAWTRDRAAGRTARITWGCSPTPCCGMGERGRRWGCWTRRSAQRATCPRGFTNPSCAG